MGINTENSILQASLNSVLVDSGGEGKSALELTDAEFPSSVAVAVALGGLLSTSFAFTLGN